LSVDQIGALTPTDQVRTQNAVDGSAAELVRTVLFEQGQKLFSQPLDRWVTFDPERQPLLSFQSGFAELRMAIVPHGMLQPPKTGHAVPKASSCGMILKMLFRLRLPIGRG